MNSSSWMFQFGYNGNGTKDSKILLHHFNWTISIGEISLLTFARLKSINCLIKDRF